MAKTVLIAGALGVVGRSALDHFERDADCDIVALSRRAPDFATRARFISVDLNDAAACRAALADVRGVTDAIYCALHGRTSGNDTWGDAQEIAANEAMLRNFLDAIEPCNPGLKHLCVLQGAKAYGCHLGPVSLPGKERAPRHDHPNFYWAQEDLIRARGAKAAWAWTVFRPQYIVGFSIGSPINILTPIGVLAAIRKEQGLPLAYPGKTRIATEATDARLLARAMARAQEAPAAANEIFNITNGDVFTFDAALAAAARVLGLEMDDDAAISLTATMADKEKLWAQIVRKHDLLPYTLDDLVGPSWAFADAAFSAPISFFESTLKLRKAGFADCIDSEDMFAEWFADLQARRILPA